MRRCRTVPEDSSAVLMSANEKTVKKKNETKTSLDVAAWALHKSHIWKEKNCGQTQHCTNLSTLLLHNAVCARAVAGNTPDSDVTGDPVFMAHMLQCITFSSHTSIILNGRTDSKDSSDSGSDNAQNMMKTYKVFRIWMMDALKCTGYFIQLTHFNFQRENLDRE